MVSMHVLVDGSSLWRQRLQHIDIKRLRYNAVRHHGTRLPRYKEDRLYMWKEGEDAEDKGSNTWRTRSGGHKRHCHSAYRLPKTAITRRESSITLYGERSDMICRSKEDKSIYLLSIRLPDYLIQRFQCLLSICGSSWLFSWRSLLGWRRSVVQTVYSLMADSV